MKLKTFLFVASIVAMFAHDGKSQQTCLIQDVTTNASGRSAIFDNRTQKCVNWRFAYFSEGFSPVSVEIDGAPDNAGVPGTWTAITGSGACTLTGSNPTTSTSSGNAVVSNCYFPWISISYTLTGTGTLGYGARGTGGTSAGGGTGSGGVTSVAGLTGVVPGVGTDTAILTATGPLAAAGTPLCSDAQGGATTTGCTSGGATPSGFYLQNGSNFYVGDHFQLATLPVAASFAWVNQGGATEASVGNALVLTAPSGAGDNLRLRCQALGVHTKLTAAISCNGEIANFDSCGILFRNSSTGQLAGVLNNMSSGSQTTQPGAGTNQGLLEAINRYTNPTTFGSTLQQQGGFGMFHAQWIQLESSGGNIFYRISTDGVNFTQEFTEAASASFTTVPDQACYFANANASVSTQAVKATLLSWLFQ